LRIGARSVGRNAREAETKLKAITAAEANSAFDEFLDAVLKEPVLVTAENRPVGVMLSSMRDVATLFGGTEEAVTAALEEKRLDDPLARSRQEARDRKLELADDAFLEARRAAVRAKMGAS
jgi:antitoxin (DNA-binding transcriptional repressor) of toxin-antitoxin stability system